MSYVSIFALMMLVAFLFYIIDAVTKMSNDVKLVASYVQQQQRAKTSDMMARSATGPDAVSMTTKKHPRRAPPQGPPAPISESGGGRRMPAAAVVDEDDDYEDEDGVEERAYVQSHAKAHAQSSDVDVDDARYELRAAQPLPPHPRPRHPRHRPVAPLPPPPAVAQPRHHQLPAPAAPPPPPLQR